jgi:pimeloyl-ACP methyl ester carboxylesterase
MKGTRWGAAGLGLLLVLLSFWQINAAAHGLKITHLPSENPPVTLITPSKGDIANRPLVLIGHGFAGSGLVMRGFALTLAHAGYNVVLWDFAGHAANPQPLPLEGQTASLLGDAEAALSQAQAYGLGISKGVAILGHSMGSGVALVYGQVHPDTTATIAVSPVSRTVTPDLPHNLLLMAGSREAAFVSNAQDLLEQAGGPDGDVASGTARKLVVVPGVEHISILFAPSAHSAARDWLDSVFGAQPGATPYTDLRILWYGVGLLGVLLVFFALVPLVMRVSTRPIEQPGGYSGLRRAGALVLGAGGATLGMWGLGQVGLGLRDLLGLLVGGYLLVWFGLAGIISLLVLRERPRLPSGRAILGGLLAFVALWLGFGLLGQMVWLHWLLITPRLLLWPIGALLLLPWFLAVGAAAQTGGRGQIAWWLVHTLVVVGILMIALNLSPELGFLMLILPLFPIILGLHVLAAGPYHEKWSFALSGALFVSWLVLAVFPLQ